MDRLGTPHKLFFAKYGNLFSIVWSRAIIESESSKRPKGSPDRRALPIADDDPAAKEIVADLLDQFGFDVVDAGPLAEGRRFQKDTPAYCVPLDSAKLSDDFPQPPEILTGGCMCGKPVISGLFFGTKFLPIIFGAAL